MKQCSEFNLSETAFLLPLPDSTAASPHYNLRWFTPAVEVDLCGHATLASSSVLFTHFHKDADKVEFETRSGKLVARRKGEEIELAFPEDVPVETDDVEIWKGVESGLGLKKDGVEFLGKGREDAIVVLKKGVELTGLAPKFGELVGFDASIYLELPTISCQRLILYLVSRY